MIIIIVLAFENTVRYATSSAEVVWYWRVWLYVATFFLETRIDIPKFWLLMVDGKVGELVPDIIWYM